ncbi:MAG: cytochrome c oxidase subunit 3, partial [Candidatus Competibacteraceae bacterium]|nr:cytochrome c oxidase subunit 3 [Candidatus Competibacteraceae bacterium]
GVLAARARAPGYTQLMLGLTNGLGTAFLGIKFYEWYLEYSERLVPLPGLEFTFEGANPEHAQLFFNLYFTMTGLHALHLLVGIMIVLVMLILTWRRHNPLLLEYKVEIAGLYWHLVDVIWMFLFPLFYLVNPHG